MIGMEFQPQFKAVEIVKSCTSGNLLTVPAAILLSDCCRTESFAGEAEKGCALSKN